MGRKKRRKDKKEVGLELVKELQGRVAVYIDAANLEKSVIRIFGD